MATETLPSGLKIGFRRWKLSDMEKWAERAENGAVETEVLAEACIHTLEKVIDPGPYGFLKEGATALAPERLLQADLKWWLYRIRAESHPTNEEKGVHGDHYVFDWECSHNKKHRPLPRGVRLRRYDPKTKLGLKVKDLPESSIEHVRTGKPLVATLSDGEVVHFRLAVAGMERLLHDEMKRRTKDARKKNPRAPEVKPRLSDIIACQVERVASLGNNQSFERRAAYLQNLDSYLVGELQAAIVAAAPAINTNVDCYCDDCGGKTTVALPLTRGFFLPEVKIWDEEEEDEEEATPTEESPETSSLRL